MNNLFAIAIFIIYIILMLVGCSNDTWTVKPEWMGVHTQPWNCPRGYVNVRIMKDKWQCQPDVWWGIGEARSYKY